MFPVALVGTQAVAQDSPREYYRSMIQQDRLAKEQELLSRASKFWPALAERLRLRREQMPPGPTPPDGWSHSEATDRLTGARVLKSEKTIVDGQNALRIEFICQERTKQLTVSFFDMPAANRTLNINADQFISADVQRVLVPPPLDEPENKVYGQKWYFDGTKMIITGFNRNSWGVSLCGGDHGGAGYVYNAIFCSSPQAPSNYSGTKEWAWIRYSWLDFVDVKFSISTNWPEGQSRQTIPANYFLSIRPFSEGLYETLSPCDRNENVCLKESDSGRASLCSRQLEAAIQ